jgi:hypothetical protein
MTDDAWQTSKRLTPGAMLRAARPTLRRGVLYCVSACRLFQNLLTPETLELYLAYLEQFPEIANPRTAQPELLDLPRTVGDDVPRPQEAMASAVAAVYFAQNLDDLLVCLEWLEGAAVAGAVRGLDQPSAADEQKQRRAIQRQLCDLAREILPHPNRDRRRFTVLAGTGWLTPCGRMYTPPGVAVQLAEHIVQTSEFDSMPVLADALEEASCPDEELLAHLRLNLSLSQSWQHVRSCWALSTILGQQLRQS